MKVTELRIDRTYNLGNYQSVKLGVTIDPEGEEVEFDELKDYLDTEFSKLYPSETQRNGLQTPQAVGGVESTKASETEPQTAKDAATQTAPAQTAPAQATAKTNVAFGSKLFERIIARVQDATKETPTIETIEAAYELDAQARKVIEAAIMLNTEKPNKK